MPRIKKPKKVKEPIRLRMKDLSDGSKSLKKYWNQVLLDSDADDKLIKHLIDHSYEEVIKKFTKKMRNEYEALP